jgi:hypothetical protein
MGINNDTKLIFGIQIDYETMMKIMKSFFDDPINQEMFESQQIDLYEEPGEFFYRFFEQYKLFEEKYKNLFLITASPYYDTGFEDLTYYIAIKVKKDPSFTSLTIKEVKEWLESWEKDSDTYIQCLKDFDIEFEEPEFLSVSNIW